MKSGKASKSMSRRQFLGASAAALGGAGLASCAGWTGSGLAGSFVGGSDENTDPNNITVWFWDDSLQFAVDAFHAKQKKIKVNFQKLGFDDAHQKLLTSLAADTGAPDVCSLEIGLIGGFTGRGGMVDLLQPPFDAGQFKDQIVEYKWIQGSGPNGNLAAMPWDIGPGGLWYRSDLLKDAGFDVDPDAMQKRIQTWDDWFQLAEDLKKKTGDKTALFADSFNDVLWPMIEQHGHGWFKNDQVLVVEKGTKPLQTALQVREQSLDANIDWWGPEWSTGTKKNAFAGMGIACWMQGGLTKEQPQTVGKWHVIRAPQGDYNWGGSFMAIPEQSKKKEAAWEFLKFVCCSADGQNAIFKNSGIFPAFKPAWDDPLYGKPVDFFGGQKTYALWTEIAADVPANLIHPADRRANDIVGNEFTKVEKLGKDPVQAMKDAEAEVLARVPNTTA